MGELSLVSMVMHRPTRQITVASFIRLTLRSAVHYSSRTLDRFGNTFIGGERLTVPGDPGAEPGCFGRALEQF
jgi:hypothetical protein